MASRRWDNNCPVCGGPSIERLDEFVRYCRDCKFQYTVELRDSLLMLIAHGHAAKLKGEDHVALPR